MSAQLVKEVGFLDAEIQSTTLHTVHHIPAHAAVVKVQNMFILKV